MVVIAKKEVEFEDLIPRRELIAEGKINPLSPYPEVRWDYLTIYDQGGNVLARSRSGSSGNTLYCWYRGMQFIASPGYDGEETISIEWYSLVESTAVDSEYEWAET